MAVSALHVVGLHEPPKNTATTTTASLDHKTTTTSLGHSTTTAATTLDLSSTTTLDTSTTTTATTDQS